MAGLALAASGCLIAPSVSLERDDEGDEGDDDALECPFDAVRAVRTDPYGRAWLIVGEHEIELEIANVLADPEVGREAFEVAITDEQLVLLHNVHDTNGPLVVPSTLQSFTRAGVLEWMLEFPDHFVADIWVGDDGLITASAYADADGSTTGMVIESGALTEIPGYEFLGPQRDGWIAAWRAEPEPYTLGWVSADGATWSPLAGVDALAPITCVGVEDHVIEYRRDGHYVRATRASSQLIPLPDVPAEAWSWTRSDALGSHRLLRGGEMLQWLVRVDIEAGEAIEIAPELPTGWSRLDCGSDGDVAFLAADGAIGFALTDGAVVQPWSYSPELARWTTHGRSHAQLTKFRFMGRRGELALVGAHTSDNDYFGCTVTLDPARTPSDALLGKTAQLVGRPDEPGIALPGWQLELPELDPTRRCLAYFGDDANEWRVRSLASMREQAFGWRSGTWHWLDTQ